GHVAREQCKQGNHEWLRDVATRHSGVRTGGVRTRTEDAIQKTHGYILLDDATRSMFDDAELQQELSRDYRHVRFRTITFAGGIGPPLSTSRSRSCELHPDVRLQFGPRRIPAREGWDKLVSAGFPHTITRGFVSVDDPHVAVCVLPGTELDFET